MKWLWIFDVQNVFLSISSLWIKRSFVPDHKILDNAHAVQDVVFPVFNKRFVLVDQSVVFQDVHLAHGASSTSKEPLVYAVLVKSMITWQDSDSFTYSVVFDTYWKMK